LHRLDIDLELHSLGALHNMVSGTNISHKGAKNAGKVKEKIFHPSSRKAGQQERASLRKNKLATASAKRSQRQIEKG